MHIFSPTLGICAKSGVISGHFPKLLMRKISVTCQKTKKQKKQFYRFLLDTNLNSKGLHWRYFPIGTQPPQSDWVAKHLATLLALIGENAHGSETNDYLLKFKAVELDSDPYNLQKK